MLNKNTTPNLVAILIIGSSFFVPEQAQNILLNVGLFALSGAITNWLAVHMLFEKVPGLYGSGIIPEHFQEFKLALHKLATEELFKTEHVEKAIQDEEKGTTIFDVSTALSALNLDAAFDRLVEVIEESALGPMLGVLGGKEALKPLKEPFKEKIYVFLVETSESEQFQQALRTQVTKMSTSDEFVEKVEQIIYARLEELTPEMVKDIVKRMIKEHLGWLVVWGGVFGGLIGLLSALIF